MHLLDQIVRVRGSSPVTDFKRLEYGASPLSRVAHHLMYAHARYVLQDDLSAMCKGLVIDQSEFLGQCSDLIKIPERIMWIEWCDMIQAEIGGNPAERIGVLISSHENGRSGDIRVVWEVAGLPPQIDPMRIVFDFDQPLLSPSGQQIRHAEYDLTDILKHFRIDLDDDYAKILARSPNGLNRLRNEKAKIAQSVWMVGPFVAAFCMILLFRQGMEHHPQWSEPLDFLQIKVESGPDEGVRTDEAIEV